MKKTIAMMMVAALALLGCTKEPAPVQEDGAVQAMKFNLTVTPPGGTETKAVKTTWEDGDVVFVFFSGAAAPKYLEMKYDAGNKSWVQTPKDGTSEASFALDGDSGTMTAVYLPFGSGAGVVADGTSFKFDKTYYSYYFVAEKAAYEVADGVVTGELAMVFPEGYVQFYMGENDDAVTPADEAYKLGIDAVIPVGVASIGADGTVTETSDKKAKDDLPGYVYEGGYVFSGKLVSDYQEKYGNNYYFARIRPADSSRWDYFVSGKTLASHGAVVLPNSTSAVWQLVGQAYRLVYSDDEGWIVRWWPDCNYGCTRPEEIRLYSYSDFRNLPIPVGARVPTSNDFNFLKKYCTWTWIPIHGVEGAAIRPVSDTEGTGYSIFLPGYTRTKEISEYDDPIAAGTWTWYNSYWGTTEHREMDDIYEERTWTNYLRFSEESASVSSFDHDDDVEGVWKRIYSFALRLCKDE